MEIHFGAKLVNGLKTLQRKDPVRRDATEVYHALNEVLKTDPGIALAMQPQISRGTTLTFHMISSPGIQPAYFGLAYTGINNGTLILGKDKKDFWARQRETRKDLLRILPSARNPQKQMNLITQAIAGQRLPQKIEIVSAILKAIPRADFYYKVPVARLTKALDARQIIVERNDASYTLGNEIDTASLKLESYLLQDPAIMLALGEALPSRPTLAIKRHKPGDFFYTPPNQPHNLKDNVSNLYLQVKTTKQRPLDIPCGDNLRSFYTRLPHLRNQVLEALVKQSPSPDRIMARLAAFSLESMASYHTYAFQSGCFKALSQNGVKGAI